MTAAPDIRVPAEAERTPPTWLPPVEWLGAAAAARYPVNYGSAEEIVSLDPDVVVAGVYTAGPTRALLKRLGYAVVELAPAESLAAIEANIMDVAHALDRAERGERAVAALRARLEQLAATRPRAPVAAGLLRPGRCTVGRTRGRTCCLRGVRVVFAVRRRSSRWGRIIW